MDAHVLDEAVRDIARGLIAEGIDAKEAFDKIGRTAERMSASVSDIRARLARSTSWRPISDFDATPHEQVDLLLPDGNFVTGWSERPTIDLHGIERVFWFWPMPAPERTMGMRPRVCHPTHWRQPNPAEVPFNGNYREQK